MEYCPIIGNTLHRYSIAQKKNISDQLSIVKGSVVPQIVRKYV